MSLFSKGLKGLGHLAEKAAPIVGLIPGVGTLAGGAIGGLGALAAGDGLSGALKYGLEGAASGYGGGLMKGAGGASGVLSHIPGASALGSLAGLGGEAGGYAGAGSIADANVGSGAGGFLGSLEGLAGKAGHFLTGNGGKNALGLASGVSSYLNQQKANDYAKNALHNVEDSYNQRAPLRTQGLATLAGSQVGNPYATGKPNTQSLVSA